MIEFFEKYSTAMFALSGVVVGALIPAIFNLFSITKETKLRLIEKVLNKKLEAHEHLITVANQMRTMVALGGPDQDGELKRTPALMETQENFSNFLVDYTVMQTKCDRWFNSKLKREMSLFLDYLVNLRDACREADEINLKEAGSIIRNDFIEFSSRLEDVAHEYFNNDLLRLSYKTDRKWHKHPKEKTLAELNKTVFFQRKQEIINILQGKT